MKWHEPNDEPKLHQIYGDSFSEDLLIKLEDTSLKGFKYITGYVNATEGVWFNSVTGEEIPDGKVIEWKYIED